MNKILLMMLIPWVVMADLMFVDNGAVQGGATWDGLDGHSYTIGAVSGTGYSTIKVAAELADVGDTVYVRAGTYSDVEVVPTGSGILISNYPGESVTVNCNAYVSSDSTFIRFGEVSNITVRGFTVTGFGNNFWGGSFFIGQGATSSKIVIRDCTIFTDGYSVGNDNPAQLNMYASDSCSIIGCTIYIINVVEGEGAGICGIKIWSGCSNTLIGSCEMYGLQSPGVYSKHGPPGDRVTVSDCHFHDNTSFIGDIHINHDSSIVENNLITHSKTGVMVWHEAGSPGGHGTIIRHNTIFRCENPVILGNDNTPELYGVVFNDNIIYSSDGEFRAYTISPYASSYAHLHTSDYNCIYDPNNSTLFRAFNTTYNLANWRTYSGQDANTINSYQIFTDTGGGDFTLASNSPCKGTASDDQDMGVVYGGHQYQSTMGGIMYDTLHRDGSQFGVFCEGNNSRRSVIVSLAQVGGSVLARDTLAMGDTSTINAPAGTPGPFEISTTTNVSIP